VAILGPQHVGDWFSAMSGVGVAAGTEGVPGLAASIWGRPGTIVATSALGVVTVLMAWRLRGLLAAEPGLAISLGIAVSLAFSPHAYPDDLLLLAVPLVLWVRLVPRAGAAAGAALSLAWLWDVHVPLSVALRHSEAVVACVIALGAVWLVSRGPATDAAGGSMSPGHRAAARPSPSPAR